MSFQGDSGGPVAHSVNSTWVLDAIVSTTPDDCFKGEPGASVKVSYFLDEFIMPYLTARAHNSQGLTDTCMAVAAVKNCSWPFPMPI